MLIDVNWRSGGVHVHYHKTGMDDVHITTTFFGE